jgi:hypothetical protein
MCNAYTVLGRSTRPGGPRVGHSWYRKHLTCTLPWGCWKCCTSQVWVVWNICRPNANIHSAAVPTRSPELTLQIECKIQREIMIVQNTARIVGISRTARSYAGRIRRNSFKPALVAVCFHNIRALCIESMTTDYLYHCYSSLRSNCAP